eukprot:snap_masked-scaffold_4-processed-gene-16.19-mRNA-1 protein AED:1.00 eAED:1.00 QI:0/0/0/0/1/1/2/0/356
MKNVNEISTNTLQEQNTNSNVETNQVEQSYSSVKVSQSGFVKDRQQKSINNRNSMYQHKHRGSYTNFNIQSINQRNIQNSNSLPTAYYNIHQVPQTYQNFYDNRKMSHVDRMNSISSISAYSLNTAMMQMSLGQPSNHMHSSSRCYNCNQMGHLSRDCILPRACFLCGLTDHISKKCPFIEAAKVDPLVKEALKIAEQKAATERSLKTVDEQNQSQEVSDTQGDAKQLICLNCNRAGHRLKNCPFQKQCFLCTSIEHIARDCPIASSIKKHAFNSLSGINQNYAANVLNSGQYNSMSYLGGLGNVPQMSMGRINSVLYQPTIANPQLSGNYYSFPEQMLNNNNVLDRQQQYQNKGV